jgi:hypothetical protein
MPSPSRPRLRRAPRPRSTAVRLDQPPAPAHRRAPHIVRPTAHPLAGRSPPTSLPTEDGSNVPPAPQLLPSQQSRHDHRQAPQERDTHWLPKDKPPPDHPSAMRQRRQLGHQRRTRRKARCPRLPPHQRRLHRLPHHHHRNLGYWLTPTHTHRLHLLVDLAGRCSRQRRFAHQCCAQPHQ